MSNVLDFVFEDPFFNDYPMLDVDYNNLRNYSTATLHEKVEKWTKYKTRYINVK